MVKVFLQNANVLLLDEPTNHLDLYAKEILLQALQQYDGTLLFVSHDHDFITKLATTIWELRPTGIFVYEGPYEEYLWFKKQQQPTPSATSSIPASTHADKSAPKNNTSKQLRSIEQQIHKAEQDLAKESQKLSLHEYGTHEYRQLEKRIITLQETINRLQNEWEQLYSS
jgi:ATP-binding cassette subfamily F protein 3